MRRHRLDAIFAPTFVRSWPIDLIDGDPYDGQRRRGSVERGGVSAPHRPCGVLDELPVGISFLGRAWEEPKLLRFGYAFEQALPIRRAPRFLDAGADFVER